MQITYLQDHFNREGAKDAKIYYFYRIGTIDLMGDVGNFVNLLSQRHLIPF